MHIRVSKLLCIGIAAVAALAVMVSSASASEEFLIGGESVSANETFSGTGAAGQLLVPNLGITIDCSSSSGSGTIEASGGKATKASASVSFSGCSLLDSEGNPHEVCTVTVLPASATAVAIGGDEILTKPAGSQYTNIHFGNVEPEECNISPTLPVSGGLLALVVWESGRGEALIKVKSVQIPPHSFFLGANAATIDGGEIYASLTGANEGEEWGVC